MIDMINNLLSEHFTAQVDARLWRLLQELGKLSRDIRRPHRLEVLAQRANIIAERCGNLLSHPRVASTIGSFHADYFMFLLGRCVVNGILTHGMRLWR
jgi:hypothetical protein